MKHLFTFLLIALSFSSIAQTLENTEWDLYLFGDLEAKVRLNTDTFFISSSSFPEIPISTYTENADTFRIIDLEESELGCFDSYGQVEGTYLFQIQNDTMLLSVVFDECEIRVETLDFAVFVKSETTSTNEDYNAFGEVTLFPNPLVNGILNIQSNEHIDKVFIYDSSGRLLVSKSNVFQIDLSEYSTKLFFIKLQKGDKIVTRKIFNF